MSRSVVQRGTPRCDRCWCAPRWCICGGERTVLCPVEVAILIHRRESHRPTSTGRLIQRVMPTARTHLYTHDLPLHRDQVVAPGRTLWILHPQGDPPPAGADPAAVQLLLLDGSWREASRMRRQVEPWGRLVRLPPGGTSRYLLRDQHASGLYSTVEALALVLEVLGLPRPAADLRLQFELLVYAGLRTRGAIREAERFLAESPLRTEMPDLLAQLHQRRPNELGLHPPRTRDETPGTPDATVSP